MGFGGRGGGAVYTNLKGSVALRGKKMVIYTAIYIHTDIYRYRGRSRERERERERVREREKEEREVRERERILH